MTKPVEPLACPFCGSDPTVSLTLGAHRVACHQSGKVCPVNVFVAGATRAEAIVKWNKRAP